MIAVRNGNVAVVDILLSAEDQTHLNIQEKVCVSNTAKICIVLHKIIVSYVSYCSVQVKCCMQNGYIRW